MALDILDRRVAENHREIFPQYSAMRCNSARIHLRTLGTFLLRYPPFVRTRSTL